MYRSLVFAILCSFVVGGTVSCSKEETADPLARVKRQPIPKLPPVDPAKPTPTQSTEIVATKVQNLGFDSALVSNWEYEFEYSYSTNCAQIVNYKKGNENMGDFVVLSKNACPATGVATKEDVIASLKTEMLYPDVYVIKDPTYNETLGYYRSSDDKIVELCSGDYKQVCAINFENSQFKSIDIIWDWF